MLIECWALAFLSVVVLVFSAMGWGLAVAEIVRRRYPTSLVDEPSLILKFALGLASLCTASLFVGLAGGYTVLPQTTVVAAGLFGLGWRYRPFVKSIKTVPRPAGLDKIWLIWPFLYFFTRIFTAGLPQQHGDPLYYHLLSPKIWAEAGRIIIPPDSPNVWYSGIWETLYGLPMIWFGTSSAHKLVTAQIAGQWFHTVACHVGTLFLARAIIVKHSDFIARRAGLAIFVAWLASTIPGAEWTSGLAKNDYASAFFVIAGLLATMDRFWFLAGFFCGVSFSIKYFAAWALVSLPLIVPPRYWIRCVVGGTCGVALLVIRNLLTIGLPILPVFDGLIGIPVYSERVHQYVSSFGGKAILDLSMLSWYWHRFLYSGLVKTLAVIAVTAALWRIYQSARNGRASFSRYLPWNLDSLSRLFVALLFQSMVALVFLRPSEEGRRFILFIAVGIAAFAISHIGLILPRLTKTARWAAIVILPFGIFINTPLDEIYKTTKHYLFSKSDKYLIQFHDSYPTFKFINERIPIEQKVFLAATIQMYYLNRRSEDVCNSSKWDWFWKETTTGKQVLDAARRAGFSFVQVPGPPINTAKYPFVINLNKRRDLLVFEGRDGNLLDLSLDQQSNINSPSYNLSIQRQQR